MVRQPAGSPYETSTNRRAAGLVPRRVCGGRSGCGHTSPAAIGAGFVRLASGRGAHSTCGRPRAQTPLGGTILAKNTRLRRIRSPRGAFFKFCAAVTSAGDGTPRRRKPVTCGNAAGPLTRRRGACRNLVIFAMRTLLGRPRAGGSRPRAWCRSSAFGVGSGKGLRPAEKRRSRADGHECPSARCLMVRQPAGSPYETSTNRRGVRAGGAPCCGGRSDRGRPYPAAIGAGFARLASGCDWLRPAGARWFAIRRWARRRIRLHIFSVCCGGGRACGAPPQASPSKTAGQTNGDELAYRKESVEGAPHGPKGGEPPRNRATNRKERARNRFPPTRPPRADCDQRAPVVGGHPRVVRGRAGASGRRPPPAAPTRELRAGPGRRRIRLHIF